MADLSGVTVVVTRPAHQAETLCQSIEAAGGIAVRFPLLAILPSSDTAAAAAQLAQLERFHLAIFVSANAVTAALTMLASHPGWPPALAIAAVGQATARALTAHGLHVAHVAPAPYNSEALLTLPALQSVQGQRVLIIRGEGGRETLAQTLRDRGAEVAYAECYRRAMPDTDTEVLYRVWESTRPSCLVVTSNEGLENLYQLVDEQHRADLLAAQLVVVSERAVTLARSLGFSKPPIVSSAASDEAIEAAIEAWCTD
jgi:uroporphyrinogen-III synthase